MIRDRVNRWLRRVPVWAVWLAGAIPLALLVYDTLTGRLGIDPVRDIEHRLGRTALYFLIASLVVTPLLRLGRVNLMRFRRALGLLCFCYAALHLLAWVVFDMGFRWGQMGGDIIKRPWLTLGMGAFVILTILAVTSNGFSVRRLGNRWRTIHRLVYAAAILASIHWLLSLKLWSAWPLTCVAAILVLLVLRLRIGPKSAQMRGKKPS